MSQDLRFDPQLPELPLALDPGPVAELFEERWRAEGLERHVRSCRLQDVKYQPGRRCVTTYALAVDGAAGPEQTIGVVELTAAGLASRLYGDDPLLPWLGEAADPGRSRRASPRCLAAPWKAARRRRCATGRERAASSATRWRGRPDAR